MTSDNSKEESVNIKEVRNFHNLLKSIHTIDYCEWLRNGWCCLGSMLALPFKFHGKTKQSLIIYWSNMWLYSPLGCRSANGWLWFVCLPPYVSLDMFYPMVLIIYVLHWLWQIEQLKDSTLWYWCFWTAQ